LVLVAITTAGVSGYNLGYYHYFGAPTPPAKVIVRTVVRTQRIYVAANLPDSVAANLPDSPAAVQVQPTTTAVPTVAPAIATAVETPMDSPTIPVATPTTPAVVASTSRSVHFCIFSHFDQTNVRCLQDDASADLTDIKAVVVFPGRVKGVDGSSSFPAFIQILNQDGTGKWVLAGEWDISGTSFWQNQPNGADTTGPVYDTLSDIELNTGFTGQCNLAIEVRVFNVDMQAMGTARIELTC
jgi:hypothetical protein